VWESLRAIRQQGHIPGTFNRLFHLPLAAGTIAAALARVYLAAIGQKLLQSLDVLVVNILHTSSAKTTLRLLTSPGQPRKTGPSSTITHSVRWSHPTRNPSFSMVDWLNRKQLIQNGISSDPGALTLSGPCCSAGSAALSAPGLVCSTP